MILRNDIDSYKELTIKANNLLATRQHDTPEFRAIWQEIERIKNRNKGMPLHEMENQTGQATRESQPTQDS